jgi:hypothetical protein
LRDGETPPKFCKWLLPISAVRQPWARNISMKVFAESDSEMPLMRTPCREGIRPVASVARLGWQTGLAT